MTEEAAAAQGVGVLPEHMSEHFGDATLELVQQAMGEGIEHGVLLMRHSARTFDRSIHDLENRLTDHGRNLCRQLGESLPKQLLLRGYASPPSRCVETAETIIGAHGQSGGPVARTRPVEGLGIFYGLDQQKMWKGLSLAPSMAAYIQQWFDGAVPADAMIPAPLAVQLVMRIMLAKLDANRAGGAAALDLCVSHDFTVLTVRHGMGLEPVDGPDIEFLDGLLLIEKDGRTLLRSHHGGEVEINRDAYQL